MRRHVTSGALRETLAQRERDHQSGLDGGCRYAPDLKLERLAVLHAGENTFPLVPKIWAAAAHRVLQDFWPLL